MGQSPKNKEVVIVFTGDASGLKKAVDQIDKELGQLVVQTDRAQAALGPGLGKSAQTAVSGLNQTTKATRNATRATQELTKAQTQGLMISRQTRAQIQNVGFQLQDIAVTAEMGMSWTRILGQQGSQILGIFGPAGAIAGAGLAIGASFIPALIGAKEEALSLSDALDGLNDALDATTSATEAYFELWSQSGPKDSIMQQITSGNMISSTDEAMSAIKGLGNSVAETFKSSGDAGFWDFSDITDAIADVEKLENDLATFGNTGGRNAAKLQGRLDKALVKFKEDFGQTVQEARGLQFILEQVENIDLSQGPEKAVSALSELESILRPVKDDSDVLGQLWNTVLDALNASKQALDAQTAAIKAQQVALTINNGLIATHASSQAYINQLQAVWLAQKQDERAALNEINRQLADEDVVMGQLVDKSETLRKEIGDAAANVLIFSGVDISSGVDAAAKAAAILAAQMGIALGAAMTMSDLAGRVAGYKREKNDNGLERNDPRNPNSAPADSIPSGRIFTGGWPKPDKKGGGGSKKSDRDPLEEYMKALELQQKQLTMTEAQSKVYEKLGDDVDRYTTAQIDGAIAATQVYEDQKQYLEDIQSIYDTVGQTLGDGLLAMIDGTSSVKEAFKNMARDILKQLYQIYIVQQLIGTAGVGGGGGNGIMGYLTGTLANGGVVDHGNITPFAKGGVVGGPTLFPMSSGMGLMGEAGPEAVMPLSRGSDGKLGVAGPNIVINNYSGQEVTVDRSEETIAIAVGRARQAIQNDFQKSMTTGQGTYARSMEGGYLARRKAV